MDIISLPIVYSLALRAALRVRPALISCDKINLDFKKLLKVATITYMRDIFGQIFYFTGSVKNV